MILTKKELVEALAKFPDESVMILCDADTGWDMNIEDVTAGEKDGTSILVLHPSGYHQDFKFTRR
jgi:hypothetical protein